MAIFSFRPRIVDFVAWALLAIALIFAIYVRVRLRDFPLERDEGEFAYAGQLMLQGVPPYKLAYNMKLPGTYIAYAALMAVFGQTTAGIHLGLLAVNLATIVLLYRLVRELFDPLSAGMAAVAYSILSVSPGMLGMAAHATHFVAFFGLAGTYILWRHLHSHRWWQAFASGLLLGIAFLMKQQGVFLMVFGGAALAVSTVAVVAGSYRRGNFSLRQLLNLTLAAALYFVGAVLPYLLTCLWLWRAGVWDKFWFWTVEYASKYVQNVPLSAAEANFLQVTKGIVQVNWPLALLALVGIEAVLSLGRGKPGLRPFVFGFLAFSFLCVCPGFYFRHHYFIVMLPAVALFAGAASGFLWEVATIGWRASFTISATVAAIRWCLRFLRNPTLRRRKADQGSLSAAMPDSIAAATVSEKRSPQQPEKSPHGSPRNQAKVVDRTRRSPKHKTAPQSISTAAPFAFTFSAFRMVAQALVAFLLLAAVGGTLGAQSDFFFTCDPLQASKVIYASNPFVECPKIAEYLQKNTRPDDTIAVLGSEPEIFFDAQRRSATGYIYTYGLVEDQPLALKMQREMIAELEAAKPKYFVFANVRCSWLTSPKSETEIFRWAGEYLDKNYRIAGVFEPRSQFETVGLWGDQVQQYQPPTAPTELNIFWKLTPFPETPAMQGYWRLPYIMVFKRKS